jgi:hypothetical protein
MLAIDAFWHLDNWDLHSVNGALMSLLPKTAEAGGLTDYRPISLIHPRQSTFIKGCFIQGQQQVCAILDQASPRKENA